MIDLSKSIKPGNTGLKLYPDPVTVILNISLGNSVDMKTINIISANGRFIKTIQTSDRTIRINTGTIQKVFTW